mmetsp:Transcript_5473/g.17299  ORF Transcript_5473/g.17299 Transcript_5473/m.17299 type:complete len:201 (-) Transcript_5473:330-932(-)
MVLRKTHHLCLACNIIGLDFIFSRRSAASQILLSSPSLSLFYSSLRTLESPPATTRRIRHHPAPLSRLKRQSRAVPTLRTDPILPPPRLRDSRRVNYPSSDRTLDSPRTIVLPALAPSLFCFSSTSSLFFPSRLSVRTVLALDSRRLTRRKTQRRTNTVCATTAWGLLGEAKKAPRAPTETSSRLKDYSWIRPPSFLLPC